MSVSTVVTWLSAAALLVSAPSCLVWDWFLPPPQQEPMAIDLYFYDMGTGKLMVAKSDQIPPIQTDSGPHAGVRAHVLACGECPGNLLGKTAEEVREAGAYIAYLEMYTPEGKEALTRIVTDGGRAGAAMVDPMEQTLVKRVEDRKWVSLYSQAGYDLTDEAIMQCPDDTPARACRP